MAYRFTNTDKWEDSWFSELRPIAKLLFIYLCDNCDIAGFIEFTPRIWATYLGTDIKTTQGALEGLARGLTYSPDKSCVYINNFLKHQKNLPLNENNKAHIGIIKKFELYSGKFFITNIESFINGGSEGGSKGAQSPTGNGIGIGIEKDKEKEEEKEGVGEKEEGKEKGKEEDLPGKTWRTDYETYLNELRYAYMKLLSDKEWLAQLQRYRPNMDITLSLEKACKEYWATEAGWKRKKQSPSKTLDWKTTLTKALDMSINKVYL